MIPGRQALDRLLEGNRRFIAHDRRSQLAPNPAHRPGLAAGQRPFAVVLGCADSRVPPEIIFDQDAGDLFVVRVAGNIAGPSQIGSIEYAAKELGTRLIIVLGHSLCGAVTAAMRTREDPRAKPSPHLAAILEEISSSLEALASSPQMSAEELLASAVRANVLAAVVGLRARSRILRHLIENDGLLLGGAEYSLESGAVELLDAGPCEDEPNRGDGSES